MAGVPVAVVGQDGILGAGVQENSNGRIAKGVVCRATFVAKIT